jgi:hypothetical protein
MGAPERGLLVMAGIIPAIVTAKQGTKARGSVAQMRDVRRDDGLL